MVSLLFYRLYVAISSIGKTSLIFLSILLIPSLSIYAQNKSFKIKVSDGNTYDMPSAGAKLEEDSTLTIIGGQSGEELNYFQLQLKPHKKGLYEKGFTIGKYYFNYKTKMLESSYDYDASAMYSKVRNGEIIFKYTTDIYSQGVITIESISPTNIKGKFTCVVNQNIPKTGNTLTIEGTFDVPFSTLKQNNNLQNNTNQESPTTSNNKKEYKAPIGLFDINASIGVNWTKPIKAMPKRDFGTDYDLGVTFLNIRHSKEMSSATVMELHVDYSFTSKF